MASYCVLALAALLHTYTAIEDCWARCYCRMDCHGRIAIVQRDLATHDLCVRSSSPLELPLGAGAAVHAVHQTAAISGQNIAGSNPRRDS